MDLQHSARSRVGYTVVNNTSTDITVKNYGGFNYIINGRKNPTREDNCTLVIDFTFPQSGSVFFDESCVRNSLDKDIIDQLRIKLTTSDNQSGFKTTNFPIDVTVNIVIRKDHADKLTGIVESDILGIALEIGNESFDSFTGNNYQRPVQMLKSEIKEIDKGDSLISGIKLVDNDRKFNPFWTLVHGVAKILPVDNNHGLIDGLYFVTLNKGEQPQSDFIKLEDLTIDRLKAIGVYPSKQEAEEGAGGKAFFKLKDKIDEMVKQKEKSDSIVSDLVKKLKAASQSCEELTKSLAALKREKTLSDLIAKVQQETVKRKQSNFTFSEIVKSIVSIGGLVFTAVKLFT